MTYKERIEKVAWAIDPAAFGLPVSPTATHMAYLIDTLKSNRENMEDRQEWARNLARAADAATLEGIKEPTDEMIEAGANAGGSWESEPDDFRRSWIAQHAAIPRGEKP